MSSNNASFWKYYTCILNYILSNKYMNSLLTFSCNNKNSGIFYLQYCLSYALVKNGGGKAENPVFVKKEGLRLPSIDIIVYRMLASLFMYLYLLYICMYFIFYVPRFTYLYLHTDIK